VGGQDGALVRADEVLSLPSIMNFFPNHDKAVGAVQGVSTALLKGSIMHSRTGMLQEMRRNGLRLRYIPEEVQLQDLLPPHSQCSKGNLQSGGSCSSSCPCGSWHDLSPNSVVLVSVQQNGLALRYVAERLRRHPQILMEALLQNSSALELRSVACPFVDFHPALFGRSADALVWEKLRPEEQEARFLSAIAAKDFELRLSSHAREILQDVNSGSWRPLENHERCVLQRSFHNALNLTVEFFRLAPRRVKIHRIFLPSLIENDLASLLSFRRASTHKRLTSGVGLPFEEVMTTEELRQITTNDFWRPLKLLCELGRSMASPSEGALTDLCGDDVALMREVSKAGLKRVDPFQVLLVNEDIFDNMMEVDLTDMLACCEANLQWLVLLLRRAFRARGCPKYYTYTHVLDALRQTCIASACIFLWIFSLTFVSAAVLFQIATHWSSSGLK